MFFGCIYKKRNERIHTFVWGMLGSGSGLYIKLYANRIGLGMDERGEDGGWEGVVARTISTHSPSHCRRTTTLYAFSACPGWACSLSLWTSGRCCCCPAADDDDAAASTTRSSNVWPRVALWPPLRCRDVANCGCDCRVTAAAAGGVAAVDCAAGDWSGCGCCCGIAIGAAGRSNCCWCGGWLRCDGRPVWVQSQLDIITVLNLHKI